MNTVTFIIFISMFAVAVLTLFAFFPIRVTWFYERPREPRRIREKPSRQPSAYKSYQQRGDESFDDPEL